MKHIAIKQILAIFMVAVIICFTCTSPAVADTERRLFFGAGIYFDDGGNRDWWINNLFDVEIPKIVKNNGYAGSLTIDKINADKAFDYLKNKSGIFAVHTHGSKDTVLFSDGTNTSQIYRSQIESLPSGALNGVDLVVYGTCYAAQGGKTGSNMVNSTYNKGAKVVIGFEDTTYVNQMNQWLFDFFKSYSNGKSIDDSAKDGLYWAKFWNYLNAGGTDKVVIRQ